MTRFASITFCTETYILHCFLLLYFADKSIHCFKETEVFCPVPQNDPSILADDFGCSAGELSVTLPRYIFYEVNPPEGFNLRRDVYMRIAVLARKLQEIGNWRLVLPPWGKLYHWQSSDVGNQQQLPWSTFFDLPSLQKFAPVLDMNEFFTEFRTGVIDELYVLQHYKEDWERGKWEEKYGIEPCQENIPYSKLEDGTFTGWFWGYNNLTAKHVQCLSFHGHASQLKGVLLMTNARTIMFDHAEVALHDTYGNQLYWMARRSMRFASHLVEIAARFRKEKLNSTDILDGTVKPQDWRDEKKNMGTKGGPYLCVHMRRKDFLRGHMNEVPTVPAAAQQLRKTLKKLKLRTLFVATDAPASEFDELEELLTEFAVLRYKPKQTVREAYKDGGVAIIEQIICSHARYFIGTHESTFSFRIQEEREIMGFPVETTFNRLCGKLDTCEPPSKWRIVF